MIFLDPKSDIAFKKLFASGTNTHILINFLNSVLKKSEENKIVSVEINNPANTPDTHKSKQSIVDVRCTDQNKHQYIIEMQVLYQDDFSQRAQYYASYGLSRQLETGDYYEKLVPVIFVGILNFVLFKDDKDYVSKHLILNEKTHTHTLKHLEFHFVELPKFNKTIDQLETNLDKWAYLFKNVRELQTIPQPFQDIDFKDALGILERGKWGSDDLYNYEKYLDVIRNEISRQKTAERKGEAIGEARGEAKGEAKGKMKEKIEIAKAMIKEGFDSTMISKVTKLSIEDIEKLDK